MSGDDKLMGKINTLLMDEYAPHVAKEMRSAVEAWDGSRTDEEVESVLSTKINIIAVQASYPIFDFSMPKNVVIKVTFSLDTDDGPGEQQEIYYRFQHSAFGWHYQYVTNSWSYYLNFM